MPFYGLLLNANSVHCNLILKSTYVIHRPENQDITPLQKATAAVVVVTSARLVASPPAVVVEEVNTTALAHPHAATRWRTVEVDCGQWRGGAGGGRATSSSCTRRWRQPMARAGHSDVSVQKEKSPHGMHTFVLDMLRSLRNMHQ